MSARYDYENLEDFLRDRGLVTHQALRSASNDEVIFGQRVRSALKHAFQAGVVHAGGEVIDDTY